MSEKFENTIEINAIDTKYGNYRLPDQNRTRYLLSSIAQEGIEDPIQGIFENQRLILLDGFKRYYCAKKLNINIIPFESIAADEASGILKFLKISNSKSLHILEQAKLVNELKEVYQINIRNIAKKLGKSASWVSVRLSFLKEITPYVQEQVYKGYFPVQSATHTLRQFIRINKIKNSEIDQFVKSVTNKGLSTRDIDLLAQGYFKGGKNLKEQIEKGDIAWSLGRLKERAKADQNNDLNEMERKIVKDLEIVQKYMNRLIFKIPQLTFESKSFMAMTGLLAEGILSKIDSFSLSLKVFTQEDHYDQCRKKKGSVGTTSGGDECQKNRSSIKH